MNFRWLYYRLPIRWRYWARRLFYLPYDIYDKLSGRNTLVPPKGRNFTGGGNFEETGQNFFYLFKQFGCLQPDSDVLDVGSGLGRMAIPMTSYLTDGSYIGIDIMPSGIEWCQEHISSKYPQFTFQHIDLSNDLYKSTGQAASNFQFPFEEFSFDLVILTSVFTHMSYDEVINYLNNIYRVLKKGGRCFATFFTYENIPSSIKKGFSFPHQYDGYALMDDKVTSANIAFENIKLNREFESRGFKVVKWNLGSWQDNSGESLDFQDIIVLEK